MDESELEELRRLLYLSQTGGLGADNEFRLRVLLSQRTPHAATMDRTRLIRSGLFLLGMRELLRAVDRKAS